METKLENILENMMQNDNTVGALLSDSQGLCYGSKFEMNIKLFSISLIQFKFKARGKASNVSSGLITAIADQAAKIHPNSNAPVVILESAET